MIFYVLEDTILNTYGVYAVLHLEHSLDFFCNFMHANNCFSSLANTILIKMDKSKHC